MYGKVIFPLPIHLSGVKENNSDGYPERVRHWSARARTSAHISDRSLLHTVSGKIRNPTAYLTALQPDTFQCVVIGHKKPDAGGIRRGKSGHPLFRDVHSHQRMKDHQISQLYWPDTTQVKNCWPTRRSKAGELSPPHRPEDLGISFTPGSTGEPKGVVITRAGLESFVEWMLTNNFHARAGDLH